MRILVSGATGQDGSYLLEQLIDEGHQVFAGVRHSSVLSTPRIEHLRSDKNLEILDLDLSDSQSVINAIRISEPDEVYNLAAQSHVKVSYSVPEYTGNTNALGTLRLLEGLRTSKYINTVRFYQASTSELFGPDSTSPQTESTPFHPRSPYGISKLYGYWMARHHRESYGMFVSNGILFNHESPRRPKNFVSRKISSSVAQIYKGERESLTLGDLDAKRDWGHSKDYVRAMTQILRHEVPDDFVISTGKSYSVRDFVECAFKVIGVDIVWNGVGIQEHGIDPKSGMTRVVVDEKYFRPGKEANLLGDSTKARQELKWAPKITFSQLVTEMVEYDLSKEARYNGY
jgi:GDPmannose 4,6-dehydratase